MTTSIENLLQLQKAAQAGAVSPDVAAWLEKVSNDCFSARADIETGGFELPLSANKRHSSSMKNPTRAKHNEVLINHTA
ncbi:MAG: hypothetical protein GY927_10360 [bacterium]|nr:hypothetical protein [bacterium]